MPNLEAGKMIIRGLLLVSLAGCCHPQQQFQHNKNVIAFCKSYSQVELINACLSGTLYERLKDR